jgi:SH2 domain
VGCVCVAMSTFDIVHGAEVYEVDEQTYWSTPVAEDEYGPVDAEPDDWSGFDQGGIVAEDDDAIEVEETVVVDRSAERVELTPQTGSSAFSLTFVAPTRPIATLRRPQPKPPQPKVPTRAPAQAAVGHTPADFEANRRLWYFGTANREEVERILANSPENVLLVRNSSHPGKYAITKWFAAPTRAFQHELIESVDGKFRYVGGGVSNELTERDTNVCGFLP